MKIQIPVTFISLSPCWDVITVVNVKMYRLHMVGYNNGESIIGIGSMTVQAIL